MVKWLSCLPSKQAARVRFPFDVSFCHYIIGLIGDFSRTGDRDILVNSLTPTSIILSYPTLLTYASRRKVWNAFAQALFSDLNFDAHSSLMAF